MKWRQNVGADTILSDFQMPQVLKDYFPAGVAGFDREGHPVHIDPTGRVDVQGTDINSLISRKV